MRIIAGKYKNQLIIEPSKTVTRPTMDRVKESLFNILEHTILPKEMNHYNCLDAFAGSGSLGLEALSRGAKSCCFVEKNPLVYKILFKNVTHITKNTHNVCIQADVTSTKLNMIFDIVFIDPPFNETHFYQNTIHFLKNNNNIHNETIFCLEHNTPLQIENTFLLDQRKYGKIYLSFIKLST